MTAGVDDGGYDALIVTCEHASAVVPRRWKAVFSRAGRVLGSHRGLDRGAGALARATASALEAPLRVGQTTRLLVDLNRSPGHKHLWSTYSRRLAPEERELILDRHYWPYRRDVQALVARETRRGQRLLHVSVHSFTPRLAGRRRDVDIGLLYDPGRSTERDFASHWRRALQAALPTLRVRSNQPYRGTADGLTRDLRTRWPVRSYLGFELEVNQRLIGTAHWRVVQAAVITTLANLQRTA